MITIKCHQCGKEYLTNPGKTGSVYCSKDCLNKGSFARDAPRWAKGSKWGMKGSKSGKREDIGIFVRSAWEANYARYLNFLKGIGAILDWKYEAKTFEFPVKKGTRFYTPDFVVTWQDGSVDYHEVKGYMHPKGKTALERMTRYYPGIKIVMIQHAEYRVLSKQYKNAIPNWEVGTRGNV